jgi:hypothetical protein
MANGDVTVQIIVNGTTSNGQSVSFTGSKALTSVVEAVSQVLAVRTAGADSVFKIGSASGAGQLTDPIKGLVIKNLDTTNYVTIGLIDTGAKAFYTKLNAGEMMFLSDNEIDANAAGGAFSAFTSLDEITAQFNTAAGRIEILALK